MNTAGNRRNYCNAKDADAPDSSTFDGKEKTYVLRNTQKSVNSDVDNCVRGHRIHIELCPVRLQRPKTVSLSKNIMIDLRIIRTNSYVTCYITDK